MKILYIGRVFSGLETSLLSGQWQPTGVPTIYKIIERLDKSPHEMTFVLMDESARTAFWRDWGHNRDAVLALKGLRHRIMVWPGARPGTSRLKAKSLRLIQFLKILKLLLLSPPDLVYADRSNVVAAALAARLRRRPVILRVMGIYPSMWEIIRSRSLSCRMLSWCFRSPFALALCTQDGTGGESWMDAALAPSVPRQMMLNGVDRPPPATEEAPELAGIPTDRSIISFVGRLEDVKGWREYLNAILAIDPALRTRFHAVIVGTGSGEDDLRRIIDTAGAHPFLTHIPRLPHARLSALHAKTRIYVSLNKLGNLSNANLESFMAGLCVVIPDADPTEGVDVATDALFPGDCAIRLDRNRLTEHLTQVLESLIRDPKACAGYAQRMAEAARRTLDPWAERIDREIALIEAIGQGERAIR